MRNISQRNFAVQFYLRFLYPRFPHLRCLHADSITRAIHTPKMTITRSFITRALSHPGETQTCCEAMKLLLVADGTDDGDALKPAAPNAAA